MKANLARGWILGCLVACLSATTASCSDGDDSPPPLTDLERGTIATTRENACDVEWWFVEPFSIYSSLGVSLSVFPGGFKRGIDCTLAAHNCQEVEACTALFVADNDVYEDEIEHLPECGSERTDHCEGNVAKYCVSDDQKIWHQASYDCTLAGATCIEGQRESGERWTDCQTPHLQCEGPNMSYCDGTSVVTCEESSRGFLNPWVYDCADAFGSHCSAPIDETHIGCEGPAVGEWDCHDGIDGDGDGKVDCDDEDCGGHCS